MFGTPAECGTGWQRGEATAGPLSSDESAALRMSVSELSSHADRHAGR